MMVIGLTGSIAMGKSTAAAMLRRLGLAVFDADASVHSLMGPKGAALPALAQLFPGAVGPRGLDRQAVGAQVFASPEKKAALEALLHPMVRRLQKGFLDRQRRKRAPFVVLDIPLLFETGGHWRCDHVLVVSAPAFLQRQRALARPGMTSQKFDDILSNQMPDYKKRRYADTVIPTGLGKAVTYRALKKALFTLQRAKKKDPNG
ncbi:MAG: dephospho-CoA kinase [Pseudomonadota bacterium]